MGDRILNIGEGFWNIRGSFKVGGVVDIGTQSSLVRLASGGFVLLDAYTLTGAVEREVMALTEQGQAVEAILNLHPFHTIHTRAAARQFPKARLYGTARHKARAPELSWEAPNTDSPALHALFADDLSFTVPRGVDFISDNEGLHFASVLAFHPASRTLHVDDTLMWSTVPLMSGLVFHPTLKSVLERRPGAAADFRQWALELADRCGDVEQLVTAHMRKLAPASSAGTPLGDRVRQALKKMEKVLAAHERRHG